MCVTLCLTISNYLFHKLGRARHSVRAAGLGGRAALLRRRLQMGSTAALP